MVGGGDSAVEEATFLTRYAEKVYIIHRRGAWRAQKVLQERAFANPKIAPIWHATVDQIGSTDGSKVEWLRLKDLKSGEERRLDVGVFIYVGFMPNSQIFGPEIRKDPQGFVLTDERMETSLPGVYVAGDVRSQYVRQISKAVGDATTAAVAATRYIEGLDALGEAHASEPTTIERAPEPGATAQRPILATMGLSSMTAPAGLVRRSVRAGPSPHARRDGGHRRAGRGAPVPTRLARV